MKKRSIRSTIAAMVAVVTLAATVSAALPFTNGGFEAGNYTASGGFQTLGSGATNIDNWNIGPTGTIEWIKNSYWNAHSGDKSIDLSGGAPGSIYQDIDTVANKWYFVTFWMAGNVDGAPAVKVAEVSAAGQSQQYTFDTTGKSRPSNMGWVQKEFTFQATSSETRLKFTGISTGPYGAAIDGVEVTQVVYTGTDCKKDGWKKMTDSLGVYFKNQGDCVSFYATGEANLANPKDDA